jgi:hypothetical protein
MQELCNAMKRPNLQIMGIGEEVQVKGTGYIYSTQ